MKAGPSERGRIPGGLLAVGFDLNLVIHLIRLAKVGGNWMSRIMIVWFRSGYPPTHAESAACIPYLPIRYAVAATVKYANRFPAPMS